MFCKYLLNLFRVKCYITHSSGLHKGKQTCEDATSYIRKENLEAEQEDTTLNAEQRELNQAYKEYLKEAAYVVSVCYTGGKPDLSEMNNTKVELY